MLSRQQLKEQLVEIDYWPELKSDLDFYLNEYIFSKDVEMINLLLETGANPNPNEDLDDHLFYLYDEYQQVRSTSGDIVLTIMESLLKAGANPNRVWCNNCRAYDYAVNAGIQPVRELLERYGVDQNLRESI